VWLIVSLVSSNDIVRGDGTPGSAVVVAVEPGQAVTVELEADTLYQLYLLGDRRDVLVSEKMSTHWFPGSSPPDVVGPDGQEVEVRSVGVPSGATYGDHRAESRWQITTDAAGTYQIESPADNDLTLALVRGDRVLSMLGGVGLMVVLWIAAAFFGLAGLGMTLGGALWWSSRKKRARPQATPPSATPVPPFHP